MSRPPLPLFAGVALSLLLLRSPAAAQGPDAGIAAAAPATLRVVTSGNEPFVIQDAEPRGLSIDVWRAAAERLGLRYRYVAAGGIEEALQKLERGEADVAVGPISITADRARRVQFTQPYFQAPLAILAPPSESLLAPLRPFVTRAFLTGVALLIGVLLGVGALVWMAERRKNPEHFPADPIRGIGNGLWFALVTLTTVGYGDRVPTTLRGRVVAGIWMTLSLMLASSLTAFMATALTLSQIDRPAVSTAEGLAGIPVAAVANTTSARFASERGARLVEVRDVGAAVAALEAGRVGAVVFDRPMLRYHLSAHPELDLRLSAATYRPQGYGFAVARGSELAPRLDVALLELDGSGRIDTFAEHWLDR